MNTSYSPFSLFGVPAQAGTDTETTQSADSDLGPKAIREAYHDLFGGYNIPCFFSDEGDLLVSSKSSVHEVLSAVQRTVQQCVTSTQKIALIGGSHTLTLGSLRALHDTVGEYSLLYIDAHPDTMPDKEISFGSTLYHATKEGVLNPKRLALVGIRQIEEEEHEFIAREEPTVVSPLMLLEQGISAAHQLLLQKLPPPVYISIDLDGLDPAYAPGVTTPFPLGLTHREALSLTLPFCNSDLLGIEIVEHSPSRDIQRCTAFLAAALLQELTAATCKDSRERLGG
ncbi:arginase family protein [bacterium]|nr:arginase family protein [bacterium]